MEKQHRLVVFQLSRGLELELLNTMAISTSLQFLIVQFYERSPEIIHINITDGQLVTRSIDWSQLARTWVCSLIWSFSRRNDCRSVYMSIKFSKYRRHLSCSPQSCDVKCLFCDQMIGELLVMCWERAQGIQSSGVFCKCHDVLTWLLKPWQGNSVPLCFCLAFSLSCFLDHYSSCSQRHNCLLNWFLNENGQLDNW